MQRDAAVGPDWTKHDAQAVQRLSDTGWMFQKGLEMSTMGGEGWCARRPVVVHQTITWVDRSGSVSAWGG